MQGSHNSSSNFIGLGASPTLRMLVTARNPLMGEKELTDKMTIAEGLQELKRIDAMLDQKKQVIARYCSKKKGLPDEVTNQDAYVKEQAQSGIDLLKRYSAIKTAIQKANLEASFTLDGKTFTLAEAILFKQYLLREYQEYWMSFNPATAQAQINFYTNQIANRMNTLTPEQLTALNLVPELFYDPKKVQAEVEKLLTLKTSMDALIDKTNHATTIEI
jgi:hypothetical protein